MQTNEEPESPGHMLVAGPMLEGDTVIFPSVSSRILVLPHLRTFVASPRAYIK